jgi:acyl-CoA thioester hydrolase
VSALLPSEGIVEGSVHRYPVRVYYEDTDAGGIVYHATYLRLAERARSEYLRVVGWPHDRIKAEGCFWAIRRAEIDYLQPALLDDLLVIETEILAVKGASVFARQTVCRGDATLANLKLQIVLLTTSGRPARLPPALRAIFRSSLEAQEGASDPCPIL